MRNVENFIHQGLMFYRRPRRADEHRSWTKFDDRPVVRKDLSIEHIHAYRIHEASKLPAREVCPAGRPVVAMKYWDKDYRNGKKGWN